MQPLRVAVIAPDDVVLGDLATPTEVFGWCRDPDGVPLYDVRVCSRTNSVRSRHVTIDAPFRLASVATAHTVIVPGTHDLASEPDPALLRAIRRAADRGARVASICTGAFLLAAAGVLDGLRATTHWLAANALRARFPSVDVDPNVLYVDNGHVLTSAGATAGVDLCVHLIRNDFGAEVAANAARAAVMPPERAGGQAQFIQPAPPLSEGSIAPLLGWIQNNLGGDLGLDVLAKRAAMSTRTLSRRFREQTGTSPARYITQARARRAQELLETTDLAVERVATKVGFGSATVLREHFHRVVGTSPQAYRQAFSMR